MPTKVQFGKQIKEIELLDLFAPTEGMITQYYGRIGSGKTYNATADVLKDLENGDVVYVNWPIEYNGFDQRESPFYLIRAILFPWVKRFYKFPKDNLRYIEIDENFIDVFSTLTDCKIYLDEGHVVFDSYEMAKMNIKKRTAVLHTRHFNRSINIISQRPSAIHVTMRANVNVFYKCEKILTWPWLVFRKSEIQDTKENDLPDEEKVISKKLYLANKKVMSAYNTQYLRGDMQSSQKVFVEGYELTFTEKIDSLIEIVRDRLQAFRCKRSTNK